MPASGRFIIDLMINLSRWVTMPNIATADPHQVVRTGCEDRAPLASMMWFDQPPGGVRRNLLQEG